MPPKTRKGPRQTGLYQNVQRALQDWRVGPPDHAPTARRNDRCNYLTEAITWKSLP